MRKGISLGGWRPMTVYDGGYHAPVYPANPQALHVNDYRQPSVREFCNTQPCPTTWVKVWLNLNWLLEGYDPTGKSWEHLFAHMNSAKNYAMQSLDRQIRAANLDGKYVVLTLHWETPPWMNVSGGQWGPNGESPLQAYPDGTPGKPFQWVISYLTARYMPGVAASDGPGLHNGASVYGNPYTAWVYFLEPLNEPNALNWPNINGGQHVYGSTVPTIIKSSEEASWAWAGGQAPFLLFPAVLDSGGVHYRDYTANVVSALQGWQPRKYIGWSVHNYGDVRYYPSGGARSNEIINTLAAYGWKGGTDVNIFITESGLNGREGGWWDPVALDFTTVGATGEYAQVVHSQSAYTDMYNSPYAYAYMTHLVNDVYADTWHSGARRNWNQAAGVPGAKRPFHDVWGGFTSAGP